MFIKKQLQINVKIETISDNMHACTEVKCLYLLCCGESDEKTETLLCLYGKCNVAISQLAYLSIRTGNKGKQLSSNEI